MEKRYTNSKADEWVKAGILRDHEDGAHEENPLDSCPECREELEDRKDLLL